MKKETKRYMIVEYAGCAQRVYDSQAEAQEVIENTRKYNNRLTSKYICGNIKSENIDGKYVLTIHLYHKLSNKDTISNIDGFTRRFTMRELQTYFAPKTVTKEGLTPDINIAYLETPNNDKNDDSEILFGVKYIPVYCKGDEKYFDDEFISKCLFYHAKIKDLEFFKVLANEFSPYHAVGKKIEMIDYYIDRVENLGYDPINLYYAAIDLFRHLIVERNREGQISRDETGAQQISIRRKRDFAFFLRDYNARKKPSPLRYNGSTTSIKKQELLDLREGLVQRSDVQSATLLLREVPKKKGKK